MIFFMAVSCHYLKSSFASSALIYQLIMSGTIKHLITIIPLHLCYSNESCFVPVILKLVLHQKESERIHFILFECNIPTMLQQTITERTSNPIILKRTITYNMTLRGKVESNGNVVNVDAVDVYTVERYYRQNKSIVSLKRLIIEIRNYNAGKYFDHFALIYSRDASINEDVEILPHVNSKYTSAKSYIRTSNKILEVKDQLLSSGHSVAAIYDKVLQESGGSHNSQSQSSEPWDKSQIYRQKNK